MSKYQNRELKNCIANLLIQKRGYVYEIPKGENVILTLTGGVDSSVAAQLIIEKWDVTIYPLYLARGASAENFEIDAARRVVAYLQDKYPDKIKDLKVLEASIPPKELKGDLSRERILERGHPLRNTIIQSYAIQYGAFLNDQGVQLRTVLVGSVASDHFPGSRDIDLIVNTLHACMNLEEWKWQIMSPFFQEGLLELKPKITKIDLIDWGLKNNFPFNLTRTCISATKEPCGICDSCIERKETFSKADSGNVAL
jgi:7-cyano-7-deazaguanine synthase in queuosine biosynthesis